MGDVVDALRGDPFQRIRLNPSFPFRNGDIVKHNVHYNIEDEDEEDEPDVYYAKIDYDPTEAAFILLYFEDEACTNFWIENDCFVKQDFIFDIGIENLELYNNNGK